MSRCILKRYPTCWIAFGLDALRIAGACDEVYGPPRRGVCLSWSKYKDQPLFGFELERLEEVMEKCRVAGVLVKLDQSLPLKKAEKVTAQFVLE